MPVEGDPLLCPREAHPALEDRRPDDGGDDESDSNQLQNVDSGGTGYVLC